jgi:hypothetical protein
VRRGGSVRKRRRINEILDFALLVRDQEVEGSNPFAPTTSFRILPLFFPRLNGQMDEYFKIQVRRTS